jgi:hypothetical protein
METITLYRIATPKGHGMWYNENGEPDGAIFRLCPDAKAVDVPMGYKSIHYDFGKLWYSAGDSIPMMKYWFTRYDAQRLVDGGFKIFEIESAEYRKLEHEILFTKEGVTSIKEISIDDIWEPEEILLTLNYSTEELYV